VNISTVPAFTIIYNCVFAAKVEKSIASNSNVDVQHQVSDIKKSFDSTVFQRCINNITQTHYKEKIEILWFSSRLFYCILYLFIQGIILCLTLWLLVLDIGNKVNQVCLTTNYKKLFSFKSSVMGNHRPKTAKIRGFISTLIRRPDRMNVHLALY
jgi:hypothetical protein